MKIVVLGDAATFEMLKGFNAAAEWVRIKALSNHETHADADAFFLLTADSHNTDTLPKAIPVFINSVLMPETRPSNVLRINGWSGFLEKEMWEIAGIVDEKALDVLKFINKKVIEAPDQPGLIAPRIIAMIINEAFYALDDGVSTTSEIDTAMKLGTNYPFGPFEWAEKIGHQNIYALLNQLSVEDKRYLPAAGFRKQIQGK